MNKIATPDLSTVEVLDSARENITVLNPVGYPPKVARSRWRRGSRASTARPSIWSTAASTTRSICLKQVQAWFAEHMPSVKTKIISHVERSTARRSEDLGRDQGQRRRRDHRRRPLKHLRAGGRHARHHARDQIRRADRRAAYRQIRQSGAVGDQDGTACREAPRAFVPQPVMGKTAAELRAYVDGKDPITGRPVMQEVIEGLTSRADRRSSEGNHSSSAPRRAWSSRDTEDNLQRQFLENNWTDGLPIVLPTEKRVAEMLAHTSRKPDEIVGHMPPTEFRVGLGIHRREGRGQRRDGRRAAGIFPGDPGAGGPRCQRARLAPRARRRRWWWSTARSATRSA